MELLDSFHFSRPWALLLLPILVIQSLWFLKFRHHTNPWKTQIRQDLQPYLLKQPQTRSSYLPWVWLSVILSIFALAGPSWSQQARPVFSKQEALVIVLDMSLSMLAQDQKPDRATRSKLKLMDLLEQRQEGLTALVAFAGNAYTVAPLTSDTATIRNLLPALDPALMPELGSAAEKGVEQAEMLFRQAGVTKGHILLVTDGLDETASRQARKALGKDTRLSILAIGTEGGAPIPLGDQGFVKDAQGNVIISQLDLAPLIKLQSDTSARLSQLQLDNSDLDHLMAERFTDHQLKEEKEAKAPLWIEQGHWFLLPVLPLAALAFRKGWLLLLPLILLLPSEQSLAVQIGFSPEQQSQRAGEQAYEAQDYEAASQLLTDPAWQGSAYYRNKEYSKAAQAWKNDTSAQGYYNLGNALFRQGQYQEAIDAYQQSLALQPEQPDARHNQALAQKRLEEQTRNQDQDQNQNPQQNPGQSEEQQNQNQADQRSDQNQDQSSSSSENNSASENARSSRNTSDNPSSPDSSASNASEPDQSESDKQNHRENDVSAENGESTQNNESAEGDRNDENDRSAENDRSDEKGESSQPASASSETLSEADQSLEQWLRRIPDDPSGLLRRKFEYEAGLKNERYPEERAPW